MLQEGIILSCTKPMNKEEPRSEDLIYQHKTERRKAKLILFQELKSQGLNITAIARRIGSNRDTVRNYLKNGYPKVKCKATLNYDEYLEIISEMCNNQLNPSAMFHRLKDLVFKGCIKSFTGWSILVFQNINSKGIEIICIQLTLNPEYRCLLIRNLHFYY